MFNALFLFRKLFLIKSKSGHYAQFAEDVAIGNIVGREFKGVFVDVGCFHPKKHRNTWRLYRQGWRGINIDIDEIKIRGFNIIRPKDTNVQCAGSDVAGEVNYWTDAFYSLTNSLSKDFADARGGYVKSTTTCRRLTDIVDESDYKDRKIDFLSVDAEGHDLNVIESLDFDRYAPRLIAGEAHYPTLELVQETEIYQFLKRKG
ncbi:MAG: FkbM family methyltransferase [Planctomycetota bacterium]